MTKNLKIDFKDLTFESFSNGNFDYDKVENIEIDYFNYNPDDHGELDLNKLLKFNNLSTLSVVPGEKDYDDYFISLNLTPLVKFSSLKKVYLEGKGLCPFGLSSDWYGKGNFEINTKIRGGVFRMAQWSTDAPSQSKKLTFEGTQINYFDNVNFDEFLSTYEIEERLPHIEELVFSNFNIQDQFDEKKIIDLSSFSKLINLKKFSINYEDFNTKGGPYFDFDTFPMFEKLEYLQVQGRAHNYDFIKNLKQLRELEIGYNFLDKPNFFSTKEIIPLLNLKKIEIAYSEMPLITNFSQHHQNFPNLEELSLTGYMKETWEEGDGYSIDPKVISVFTSLKTLRMPSSSFLSSPEEIVDNNHELGEYEKALDWCKKRLKK